MVGGKHGSSQVCGLTFPHCYREQGFCQPTPVLGLSFNDPDPHSEPHYHAGSLTKQTKQRREQEVTMVYFIQHLLRASGILASPWKSSLKFVQNRKMSYPMRTLCFSPAEERPEPCSRVSWLFTPILQTHYTYVDRLGSSKTCEYAFTLAPMPLFQCLLT